MTNMPICRRAVTYLLFLFLSFLFAAGPCLAVSFENEDNIHISNLHRIDDDLIALGSNVTVDGLIEGDLITGCYVLNTNGHVKASQNVLAVKLHHTGRVDGALRGYVAELTELDGYIGRSVLLAGDDIRLGEKSVVEKDLLLYAGSIQIDGLVQGSARLRAESVTLSGTIHGDVRIRAPQIKIVAPAVIKGDLTYMAPSEDALELAPGVIILGKTTFELCDEGGQDESRGFWATTFILISKTLAAFLFGIILLLIFNKYALEAAKQLRTRLAIVTATGLLTMIIFAIGLFLLSMSVAMLTVGWILQSGNSTLSGAVLTSLSILLVPVTGFVTTAGAILFYSGKIIVGVVIGYLLLRIVKPNAAYLSYAQLLLGLVILSIVFSIPYLGLALYLILSTIGAGAIVLGVKYCRRESNQTAGKPELGKD